MTAHRAVPAARDGCADRRAHLRGVLRHGIQRILRHADHAAHRAKAHAKPREVAQRTRSVRTTAKSVFHRFQPDLPRRFLLIGIALHTHFGGFRLSLHPVGLCFGLLLNFERFGFSLCADDLHPRGGLRLNRLAVCCGFRLGFADPLLPDEQILFGVLLLHAAEIRVVVRRYNAADVELRHGQTVLIQRGIDPLAQRTGERHEVLVDLQNVDGIFLDRLREVALDLRHDHRTEEALAVSDAQQLLLSKPARRTDDLEQQFARIGHADVKLARRADLDM